MADYTQFVSINLLLFMILYSLNNSCYALKRTKKPGRRIMRTTTPSDDPVYDIKNDYHHLEPSAIILPTTNHTSSVIFLHGFADTGEDLKTSLQNLSQPYMKIICPTSKMMNVTLNMGAKLNAWYDLRKNSTDLDEEGIKNATKYVNQLINEEIEHGIPSERIIVGGFSQGGTLALHCALTFPKKLAAAVAFSTWFPVNDTFFNQPATPVNEEIPTLKCHPMNDPAAVGKWPRRLDFKSYSEFDKAISEDELEEMKEFMRTHVSTP